jgi:hypothetical protein
VAFAVMCVLIAFVPCSPNPFAFRHRRCCQGEVTRWLRPCWRCRQPPISSRSGLGNEATLRSPGAGCQVDPSAALVSACPMALPPASPTRTEKSSSPLVTGRSASMPSRLTQPCVTMRQSLSWLPTTAPRKSRCTTRPSRTARLWEQDCSSPTTPGWRAPLGRSPHAKGPAASGVRRR